MPCAVPPDPGHAARQQVLRLGVRVQGGVPLGRDVWVPRVPGGQAVAPAGLPAGAYGATDGLHGALFDSGCPGVGMAAGAAHAQPGCTVIGAHSDMPGVEAVIERGVQF